jgi:hypothetical protein
MEWSVVIQQAERLGLVIEILGAVLIALFLIALYGLPPAIDLGGQKYAALEQTDAAEALAVVRPDGRGRVGLAVLAVGFLLELVGTFSSPFMN